MKSYLSFLVLAALLTSPATAKNKKHLKIKQAIEQNAENISENSDLIEANTQAISNIQVQSGKRRLYVHIDGHGNIGELIFGHHAHAGIEGDDYSFYGDGGHLDVGWVKYFDASCTEPLVSKFRAVYRFLGKPFITGLERFTGQLYTVDSNAQRYVLNEYYELETYNQSTGETYDSPQCIKASTPYAGEDIFYSVGPIETPSFLAPRVNEQNGVITTDYQFDGETTIRFE